MPKRNMVAKDIKAVKKAMDETEGKREFQKLQCVYLADTQPKLSAEDIGNITRLSTHHVKMIHSNFRKYGMDSVKDKRGGRYREHMTLNEVVIGEIREARREARELGIEEIPFEDIMIMFQDEARFGRISEPKSCWVKGERPVVHCQTVREYTYAYGAVCPFDGTMDSLILPWANSTAMSIYL